MSCGQARRVLWPDAAPHVVTGQVEDAERHLAGCEECRLFLKEMRGLARLTHDLAPRPQAPRDVRDRLFKAIARARTGVWGTKSSAPRRWAAVTVLAMIILGVAIEWGRRSDLRPDPIVGLADDHMRATRGDGLVSGDSTVISRWLAERLPFAMDVPDLPSLKLRGARLCLRDGQRGGVVEYSVDGRPVSYFVVPDWHSSASPPTPRQLHLATHEGYHIAAWREPGLVHALVGDLPQARLIELARLCMNQVMAFLDTTARRMKNLPLSGV